MMDYGSLLSDRLSEIKPSPIRKFFDLLEGMTDAISLGIGEPDFVTPWHIRDAGIYSLEKGYTKYTPNSGLTELRREIVRYMSRRFALGYEMNQVLVTVGGSEGLDLCMRVLLNPGDEVLIPEPSFVAYAPVTRLCGGVVVPLETTAENRFRLTAEQVKKAITPKTKVLVLPYPNNPTGGILERADLEGIAEVLRGTNIMVLSDEIYGELTYGLKHVSIANLPGMIERTIIVGGFSKSYAMTGWRMGYCCGPRELIAQMTKVHQYAIMSAPTTSQYAAIEALRDGDGDIALMRTDYDRRRRLIVDGFRELGLPCFEPQGAFYCFPDIRPTGMSSDEFCEKLLLSQKVAAIPGTAFGASGEGFIRCCYAVSVQDITEALRRIKVFLEEIKG